MARGEACVLGTAAGILIQRPASLSSVLGQDQRHERREFAECLWELGIDFRVGMSERERERERRMKKHLTAKRDRR